MSRLHRLIHSLAVSLALSVAALPGLATPVLADPGPVVDAPAGAVMGRAEGA